MNTQHSNNTAFCAPVTAFRTSFHTASATSAFTAPRSNTTHKSAVRVSSPKHHRVVALVDLRDADTKAKAAEEAELQMATDPFPGPYAELVEQLNGRAAMVGFAAGLLIELTSGVTINQQIALIASSSAKQGFLMLAPFIELISRSLVN